MSVTIDGKVIEVTPVDKNIVDVASRAKIGIPAPCYRTQRKNGCCSACVVEIDGEQKFACSTVPENGMNIVVNRADLKAIRKQRLLEYKEGIKSGNPCECFCCQVQVAASLLPHSFSHWSLLTQNLGRMRIIAAKPSLQSLP